MANHTRYQHNKCCPVQVLINHQRLLKIKLHNSTSYAIKIKQEEVTNGYHWTEFFTVATNVGCKYIIMKFAIAIMTKLSGKLPLTACIRAIALLW